MEKSCPAAHPIYPGRAKLSYLLLQYAANFSTSFDSKVTWLAEPTFPHINGLARLTGPTFFTWYHAAPVTDNLSKEANDDKKTVSTNIDDQ